MPQFVILRHTLPAGSLRSSHFDLMLEHAGQLLTWAIAELPGETPQPAEELAPHRLDYLTYEGPISSNRGEVQRVVAGSFEWRHQDSDRIRVGVSESNPSMSGELELQKGENRQVWICQFHPVS